MQTFENHLIIEQPVEMVFDFIADFENLPKWNYYIVETRNIDGKASGVGARFRQVRKTDQQEFHVVEYEPNRAVAVETLPPTQPLKMRFTFEPIAEGTRLTDRWELEPDVPGPLAWLAARRIKVAVADNLKKLKQLLETGEVQLQDGREVAL